VLLDYIRRSVFNIRTVSMPSVWRQMSWESFRPLVDRRVSQWISHQDAEGLFDSKTKSWMIGATTSRYIIDREERFLFDIILRTANSLGDSRDPEIPSLLTACPEDVAIKREVRRVETDEARGTAAG
jgi:hypothetical protein